MTRAHSAQPAGELKRRGRVDPWAMFRSALVGFAELPSICAFKRATTTRRRQMLVGVLIAVSPGRFRQAGSWLVVETPASPAFHATHRWRRGIPCDSGLQQARPCQLSAVVHRAPLLVSPSTRSDCCEL